MASRQFDEEAIFHIARRIEDPQARKDYLDQVCAGEQALRERVEALLKVHHEEHNFLESIEPGSTTTADVAPLQEHPGTTIGRYRLMEQIGEGGMGTVFVAEQQRPLQRKVALKVIKPGMDSKAVIARFEAERQALALMDHANIARVFDAGTTESGRPYFVMELVRGIPITDYCDQNKLTVRQRLELFVQVCSAIQHAHQKGIIHRDIKPSNVLVTLHDGTPVPKVIDFGVAKALHQRLTERTVYTGFAQIVGTPLYMSPEQAELSGLDIDTRSDVYALGVLLYELLTGVTPFDKQQFERIAFDEIRRVIRETEPSKPSTKVSSLGQTAASVSARRSTDPRGLSTLLSGDLDVIVMKALEKDRNRRYDTASGFAEDVRHYMEDQPILARSPSLTYRVAKFSRRHRWPITIAALFVGVLFAGIAATTSMWNEARQQAQRAEEKAIEANRKRAELERLLRDYRKELYEKATTAAMLGLPNTAQLISDCYTVNVDDWRIAILEGQHLIYKGKYEDAIERLRVAVALSRNNGEESVAAKALLSRAYFCSGRLLESMHAVAEADRLNSRERLDDLFLAWAHIFSPKRAQLLLEQYETKSGSFLPVAMLIRSEVVCCYSTVNDRRKAVECLQNIETAKQFLGESKLTMQGELLILIGLMAMLDPQSEEHQDASNRAAMVVAHMLQTAKDDDWAMMLAHMALVHGNRPNAESLLRELCQSTTKQVGPCTLALRLYQSGIADATHESIQIASRLTAPEYRGYCALVLAEMSPSRAIDSAEGIGGIYALLAFRRLNEARRNARELLKMISALPSTQVTGEWETYQISAYHYILNGDDDSQQQFLESVNPGHRLMMSDAQLLVGLMHLAQDDLERAKESFRAASSHNLPASWQHLLAVGLLRRIKDPKWVANEKSR